LLDVAVKEAAASTEGDNIEAASYGEILESDRYGYVPLNYYQVVIGLVNMGAMGWIEQYRKLLQTTFPIYQNFITSFRIECGITVCSYRVK